MPDLLEISDCPMCKKKGRVHLYWSSCVQKHILRIYCRHYYVQECRTVVETEIAKVLHQIAATKKWNKEIEQLDIQEVRYKMELRMVQCGQNEPINLVVRGNNELDHIIASIQQGQIFVRQVGHEVANKLGLLVDNDGYWKVSRIGP